jgi:pimeloyl-ACP methyl ester carboxylesterase
VTARTSNGLAFEVAGSGPAVLLIHAGIADRTMWEPQWERWRDDHTLVRYDQRGFGESADPDGPYALHEDAAAVLDAAGIERAALVGASMGGGAAIDLALARPERVSALVTVGSTPSGWKHDPSLTSLFDAVDAAYEGDGVDAANELELRIWIDGPSREPAQIDPALRARVGEMNRAALLREDARERRGANPEPVGLEPPALPRLGEIAAPTLVLIGELDQPSVNAGAAALADGVPGAGSATISGASHLPSLERPEEFDQVVRPFFGRLPRT